MLSRVKPAVTSNLLSARQPARLGKCPNLLWRRDSWHGLEHLRTTTSAAADGNLKCNTMLFENCLSAHELAVL